jgi:hypothetical protein
MGSFGGDRVGFGLKSAGLVVELVLVLGLLGVILKVSGGG